MTMRHTFEDCAEYLLFKCFEAVDWPGLAALIEAMRSASENGKRTIVVDFRAMEGRFDNLMRFRAGGLTAEKLRGRRILSLARPEDINHLAENTAVNRGAQLLTTADEAE